MFFLFKQTIMIIPVHNEIKEEILSNLYDHLS